MITITLYPSPVCARVEPLMIDFTIDGIEPLIDAGAVRVGKRVNRTFDGETLRVVPLTSKNCEDLLPAVGVAIGKIDGFQLVAVGADGDRHPVGPANLIDPARVERILGGEYDPQIDPPHVALAIALRKAAEGDRTYKYLHWDWED